MPAKIRACFADEKINSGRQDELDIVKGLAIIFMIWCHVFRELEADTSTLGGKLVDSIDQCRFFLVGLFICWSGILYLLHERFSKIGIGLLKRMSRDINRIFCIHWALLGIPCVIKSLILPDFVPGFWLITLIAVIVGSVSVIIAGKVSWRI